MKRYTVILVLVLLLLVLLPSVACGGENTFLVEEEEVLGTGTITFLGKSGKVEAYRLQDGDTTCYIVVSGMLKTGGAPAIDCP